MLRVARLTDVPGITRVHVDSWQTTYAGLMPEDILANINYERRAQNMERFLRGQPEKAATFVAEENDRIVGFAQCGPNRDPELAGMFSGELYGIYLLKDWQRKGLGRQLVLAVTRFFLLHQVESMIVWALTSNQPARRFYEALGGEYLCEREIEIQGHKMGETSYGWKDLRRIAL